MSALASLPVLGIGRHEHVDAVHPPLPIRMVVG